MPSPIRTTTAEAINETIDEATPKGRFSGIPVRGSVLELSLMVEARVAFSAGAAVLAVSVCEASGSLDSDDEGESEV